MNKNIHDVNSFIENMGLDEERRRAFKKSYFEWEEWYAKMSSGQKLFVDLVMKELKERFNK